MHVEKRRAASSQEQCAKCKRDVSNPEFLFCPFCGFDLCEFVTVHDSNTPQDEVEEILGIIERFIAEDGLSNHPVLSLDMPFDDLGLDSLTQLELVMDMEQAYNISIPTEFISMKNSTVRAYAEAVIAFKNQQKS